MKEARITLLGGDREELHSAIVTPPRPDRESQPDFHSEQLAIMPPTAKACRSILIEILQGQLNCHDGSSVYFA